MSHAMLHNKLVLIDVLFKIFKKYFSGFNKTHLKFTPSNLIVNHNVCNTTTRLFYALLFGKCCQFIVAIAFAVCMLIAFLVGYSVHDILICIIEQ